MIRLTYNQAIGVVLFLIGFFATLAVFAPLHLALGMPWGASLLVAAPIGAMLVYRTWKLVKE